MFYAHLWLTLSKHITFHYWSGHIYLDLRCSTLITFLGQKCLLLSLQISESPLKTGATVLCLLLSKPSPMEQDQVPLILRQDSMVQSFSSSSLLDWVRIPIRTLSCFRRSSMLRDSSLESSPEQARWPSRQVGGGDCSPP